MNRLTFFYVFSNGHIHFNFFVVSVVYKFEVFILEVFYICDGLIQFKLREWMRNSLELLLQWLNMV